MLKSSSDTNSKIQEFTLESYKNLSYDHSCIDNFYKGMHCLLSNHIMDSKNHFMEALNGTDETEVIYFEYLSFLGLAEVLLNKSTGGLSRCYEAVNGFSNDPNLYFNIAYAEYILDNRRRSVIAIDNLLKFDANNTYAEFFKNCMAQRNKQRTNMAQNIIGKLFRKKKSCSDKEFNNIFKDYITNKINQHIENVTPKQ